MSNKCHNVSYEISLQQARYQHLMSSQYRAVQAILLCFSISDRKSLIRLFDFYVLEMSTALQLSSLSEPPVIYLVGLKSDLEDERQVSTDEVKVKCQSVKMSLTCRILLIHSNDIFLIIDNSSNIEYEVLRMFCGVKSKSERSNGSTQKRLVAASSVRVNFIMLRLTQSNLL